VADEASWTSSAGAEPLGEPVPSLWAGPVTSVPLGAQLSEPAVRPVGFVAITCLRGPQTD